MSLSKDLLKFLQSLKDISDYISNKSHDNKTDNGSCNSLEIEDHVAIIHLFSCVPALAILVILSFQTRRRSFALFCNSGYPGFPNPLNILEMRRPTVPYVAAFVAMSNLIFTIFKKRYSLVQPDWSPWLSTFINFAIVLVYAFVQYPIFAAISQPSKVANVVGLLYSLGYLSVNIYIIVIGSCLKSTAFIYLILMYLPSGISFAILLIYFILQLYREIRSGPCGSDTLDKNNAVEEYEQYVKKLLVRDKRTPSIQMKSKLDRIYSLLTGVTYTKVAGFYYPPRLICSLAVAFVLIYNLAVEITLVIIPFLDLLIKLCLFLLEEFEAEKPRSISQTFWNLKMETSEYYANVLWITLFYLQTFRLCFLFSLVLSLFINVLHIPLILNTFRNNMLTLSKKGFNQIRKIKSLKSPSAVVLGFIRYSGYQIGFLAWGFIIQFFVFTLFSILLAVIVYIPCMYEKNPLLLNLIAYIAPGLTFTIFIYVIQLIVTRFVFTKNRGRILAINNRHVFFVYAYFAFFYNVLIGLFTGLLRILLGLIAGIICLGRLDFSSLPNPCESLDNGYVVYLGFLFVEQYHQNPVLRLFLIQLEQLQRERCTSEMFRSSLTDYGSDGVGLVSNRARIRWHLAYTLLNNRGLLYYRKHAIAVRIKKFNAISPRLGVASGSEYM